MAHLEFSAIFFSVSFYLDAKWATHLAVQPLLFQVSPWSLCHRDRRGSWTWDNHYARGGGVGSLSNHWLLHARDRLLSYTARISWRLYWWASLWKYVSSSGNAQLCPSCLPWASCLAFTWRIHLFSVTSLSVPSNRISFLIPYLMLRLFYLVGY